MEPHRGSWVSDYGVVVDGGMVQMYACSFFLYRFRLCSNKQDPVKSISDEEGSGTMEAAPERNRPLLKNTSPVNAPDGWLKLGL